MCTVWLNDVMRYMCTVGLNVRKYVGHSGHEFLITCSNFDPTSRLFVHLRL